jgi:hypothetical protein
MDNEYLCDFIVGRFKYEIYMNSTQKWDEKISCININKSRNNKK